MARFQMRELVLLEMSFELAGDDEGDSEASGGTDDRGWPIDDVLNLQISMPEKESQYVMLLRGRLDDRRLGFEMEFVVGALYETEEDVAGLSDEDVEATLTFMAFPYLRELVASTTARSPLGAYHLPPRAPRPKP